MYVVAQIDRDRGILNVKVHILIFGGKLLCVCVCVCVVPVGNSSWTAGGSKGLKGVELYLRPHPMYIFSKLFL